MQLWAAKYMEEVLPPIGKYRGPVLKYDTRWFATQPEAEAWIAGQGKTFRLITLKKVVLATDKQSFIRFLNSYKHNA
ncbi:MAG: hypothetical protein GY835_00070 [bacterium]|nr:hypothetical protein [bacterium]